jgi:hypothetical protein
LQGNTRGKKRKIVQIIAINHVKCSKKMARGIEPVRSPEAGGAGRYRPDGARARPR